MHSSTTNSPPYSESKDMNQAAQDDPFTTTIAEDGVDPGFANVRDSEFCSGDRAYLRKLWEFYWEHADPHFLDQFQRRGTFRHARGRCELLGSFTTSASEWLQVLTVQTCEWAKPRPSLSKRSLLVRPRALRTTMLRREHVALRFLRMT